MFQELKFQLSTAILTILTLAAGVSAFINFEQQNHFRLPEDGVIWVDRQARSRRFTCKPDSPGRRRDPRRATNCWHIDGVPIEQATDVTKVLVRIGGVEQSQLRLRKPRRRSSHPRCSWPRQPLDRAVIYQYLVGSTYLVIGLFVYFRRGSAHKARHFYILCLASFIFLCFHYTGKLNTFDKVMYFGNLVAGLLAPTVFLHFCLTFPEPRHWFAEPCADGAALPARRRCCSCCTSAFSSGALQIAVPLLEVRWMLDRVWMVFCDVALFHRRHSR